MNYKESNIEVTLKSLKSRKDKAILNAHKQRHKDEYEFVKDFINKDDKILDIGCKDCLWFDVLSENGHKKENLIGTDFVDECIDISKEKGYIIYKGDAVALERITAIEDNTFDVITLLHVLEHIPKIDQTSLVVDCYYLLKQKGDIVFVEVPTQEPEPAEDWGHFGLFTDHQQVINLFTNEHPFFELIKDDKQSTPSKKPWSRFIFKRK